MYRTTLPLLLYLRYYYDHICCALLSVYVCWRCGELWVCTSADVLFPIDMVMYTLRVRSSIALFVVIAIALAMNVQYEQRFYEFAVLQLNVAQPIPTHLLCWYWYSLFLPCFQRHMPLERMQYTLFCFVLSLYLFIWSKYVT